jgi:hypothetical protein
MSCLTHLAGVTAGDRMKATTTSNRARIFKTVAGG